MIGLRIRKKAGKVKWSWRLAYEGSGDIEFVEPAAGGDIMAVITIPGLRPQVDKILPGTFKHAPTGGVQDRDKGNNRGDILSRVRDMQ